MQLQVVGFRLDRIALKGLDQPEAGIIDEQGDWISRTADPVRHYGDSLFRDQVGGNRLHPYAVFIL